MHNLGNRENMTTLINILKHIKLFINKIYLPNNSHSTCNIETLERSLFQ